MRFLHSSIKRLNIILISQVLFIRPERSDPMKAAKAFSPAHVTGIFKICDTTDDPRNMGSKGAGVCINQGVYTSVILEKSSKNRMEIWVNKKKTSTAEVSETVAKMFLTEAGARVNLKIEHMFQVPIGEGFGASGAGALSLALALNEVLDLGLKRVESAEKAHIAEVLCKTGLGTVIAENFGGLEIRTEPGAPGIGKIEKIPISNDHLFVSLSFGGFSTKRALTSQKLRNRINKWGCKLLARILSKPDVENFLLSSREFAERTELISLRICRVLKETDISSIVCSMPIFGEGVFTIVKRSDLEKIVGVFKKYGQMENIIVSEINFEGAKLIEN